MSFLALSNINFQFSVKKLTQKSYTATKVLPTTNWVKLIDKKEFAKAALNENSETFVMHITALKVLTTMPIHPSKAFQIQDKPILAVL